MSTNNIYKKYVGIDYGTKRVGVAVSDDQGSMAFPREVIENHSLEQVAYAVSKICNELGTVNVILGESKNFKGEDNEVMKEVRTFINHLEAKGMDVVFEPEIFSTIQAERLQGQREDIDASAAAVILQSYLDRLKKQGEDFRSLDEINDAKYEQHD